MDSATIFGGDVSIIFFGFFGADGLVQQYISTLVGSIIKSKKKNHIYVCVCVCVYICRFTLIHPAFIHLLRDLIALSPACNCRYITSRCGSQNTVNFIVTTG